MGSSSRNLGGERLLALFRDEHGTPAELAARPVDAVLGPQDDAMRVALEKRPCWHCHVPTLFQPEPACRSEEHTSELHSLMRLSYAVFRLHIKSNHIHSVIPHYITK